MSIFSLSHLMARVVMITRRRSAIFSMMGHTEQIWEEQIDSSLRRSLDHCVLHQRSHNVEGLGESILRKIQSQGRNLGSLSMNYFGAQKIRGELLPEEFRQKWSILHFFGNPSFESTNIQLAKYRGWKIGEYETIKCELIERCKLFQNVLRLIGCQLLQK